MLDTHPLAFLSLFAFTYTVATIRRRSLGVQEQETPGAYYVVKTPDGQE